MNIFCDYEDGYVPSNMPPEHQWPKFINTNVVACDSSYNCAGELLDKAVEEGYGDKVAIYSSEGNWTYRELLEKANQIAHVLKDELGLVAGNRVLLRSANNPMLVASWLAVIKAGGIVVTTIAMLRAKEIVAIAELSKVTLALCDHRLKDDLVAANAQSAQIERVLYFNDSEGVEGLEALMAEKPSTFKNSLNDGSAIAMIAFTSGTTGKPKGAVHSHHAILAVCETFSKQVLKPSPQDVFAGTPPLAFVYGLGGLLLFPLHARASTVMLEDVRTRSLMAAIEKFKVSILFTAPTGYKALLENYDRDKLGSLQNCVSAGEALSAYVSRSWMEETGTRIIDGIGSTELLHIFLAIQHPDDPMGSLGKAVPGYEVSVINEKGEKVPTGEVGHLAVRGPTGCRYLNDERQAKYTVNGWNDTGDAVKMDDEGYIWYQARSDGIIISSGYNIASPEVEQTVSQHPAVAECAVIGLPDNRRGNIVRAYVVLREGYEASDDWVKDIQEFAKKQAAPYKYPRSIVFIDALPRTPTGKIKHFALREKAKAEAAESPT